MISFYVMLQSLTSRKGLTASSALERFHLFVNGTDVSLEIASCLEAVVADGANEVVVLVDAPDMVVQIRTTLELLTTPVTGERRLLLVDELDVIFHSGSGREASPAVITHVRSLLLVNHSFVSIQG